MNPTLDKNAERAIRQFEEEFGRVLESLPRETADDLIELLSQLQKEEDDSLRKEIGQTIHEILIPKSMIVDLVEEFSLRQDNPYVAEEVASYRKKVGEAIRDRRTELNMSQCELAERVGISQSHICRLETGVHVPTHLTIEKVAKALNVPPSQLDPGFPSE